MTFSEHFDQGSIFDLTTTESIMQVKNTILEKEKEPSTALKEEEILNLKDQIKQQSEMYVKSGGKNEELQALADLSITLDLIQLQREGKKGGNNKE